MITNVILVYCLASITPANSSVIDQISLEISKEKRFVIEFSESDLGSLADYVRQNYSLGKSEDVKPKVDKNKEPVGHPTGGAFEMMGQLQSDLKKLGEVADLKSKELADDAKKVSIENQTKVEPFSKKVTNLVAEPKQSGVAAAVVQAGFEKTWEKFSSCREQGLAWWSSTGNETYLRMCIGLLPDGVLPKNFDFQSAVSPQDLALFLRELKPDNEFFVLALPYFDKKFASDFRRTARKLWILSRQANKEGLPLNRAASLFFEAMHWTESQRAVFADEGHPYKGFCNAVQVLFENFELGSGIFFAQKENALCN